MKGLVAATIAFLVTPVFAEPMVAYRKQPLIAQVIVQCGEHDEVATVLKQKFGETLRVQALSKRGSLVEMFAGPSGTWTLMETRPGGVSCLRDAGSSWSARSERVPA